MYQLGPQSGRVYQTLRDAITTGTLGPGARLPPHDVLATEFGVASLTVRHALGQLQAEGLISREQGRGTFVRGPAPRPAILVVDDDPDVNSMTRRSLEAAGHRALGADGPATALAMLEEDPAIRLVLSDVRMPETSVGLSFIRTVRRSWPGLPIAAVTGFPGDVVELLGTPDAPVLVLAKPF